MALTVTFEDSELPELRDLLNRALNTWDPRRAPKWAFDLERMVDKRLAEVSQEAPPITK